MKFRFEFDIKKIPWPINHRHKLVLMGSCFTENIGEKLHRYKFSSMENPHGILFNPVSVADAINDYCNNKPYQQQDLFYFNELYHSWKHHSRFSALEPEDALQKINDAVSSANSFLKTADYMFITLGSAWVYRLTGKATNAVAGVAAANNHKAPADWFDRQLLSNEEVLQQLQRMIDDLLSFNPGIKIIFTISPVRHLREGVIDNNRSKAVLIQAVQQMVEKNSHLYYFPAYELVLDDLRDYRYYSEDLVHPNYFATQYVWEKFTEACMTEETRKLMEEIHSINLAMKHRAFNPSSQQHKQFLNSYLEKARLLQMKYPELDLRKELLFFSGKTNG